MKPILSHTRPLTCLRASFDKGRCRGVVTASVRHWRGADFLPLRPSTDLGGPSRNSRSHERRPKREHTLPREVLRGKYILCRKLRPDNGKLYG